MKRPAKTILKCLLVVFMLIIIFLVYLAWLGNATRRAYFESLERQSERQPERHDEQPG